MNLGIYLHHISNFFSKADSACPFPFSLAATKGITICFLFLLVLRCFNSQRIFSSRNNSEILGSKLACNSPKLIAACHVFHQNQNLAIRLPAFVVVCLVLSSTAYFIEHKSVLHRCSQKDKAIHSPHLSLLSI
jgi:hypothetical protein